MIKRIWVLAGLATVSVAGAAQTYLKLDDDVDSCQLFEALNGPGKLPSHCPSAASGEGGQFKSRMGPPSIIAAPDRAVLQDVNFAFNSDQLSPDAKRQLNKVVSVMTDPVSTGERYNVEGNTDRTGSDAYNRRLSLRRARAVKSYLVAQGVESWRLQALGNGYHNLLDPQHPEDGVNRRVDLINAKRK